MSGNSTTTSGDTSGSTDPWSVQQPYIEKALGQANQNYNTALQTGPYQGNYVAQGTGQQYGVNNDAISTAQGQGQGTVNNVAETANTAANSGIGAAQGALSGLNTFGTTDSTSQNIADANASVNNPLIAQEAAGDMNSAYQTASQSTLPSLYRNAASGGNLNSDRTALADGVVRDGLAEQQAGLQANLQGSAYTTGMNAAVQGNAQQEGALSSAAMDGSMLGSSGLNGLSTSINDQSQVNNQASTAANANQTLNQAGLTNSLDQYNGTSNYGWQQLQNYYNIAAGKSFGSSTTGTSNGTSTSDPSMLSTLGSVAGMFGSLI